MQGQDAPKFCPVFKFEIGQKFQSFIFGKLDVYRSGEINASLHFDGKVAWMKDRFSVMKLRYGQTVMIYLTFILVKKLQQE